MAPIRLGDLRRGVLRLLGELADLLGHPHGEAPACFAARAASIAAFKARRLVCSAMPVMVLDDRADPSLT